MKTVDITIPASTLSARFEKHLEEMRRELCSVPWWNFKKRWIMAGAVATYQYELDNILEFGGKHQPIW
jgi:hypothetical protein